MFNGETLSSDQATQESTPEHSETHTVSLVREIWSV